jgi:hypothetical protein
MKKIQNILEKHQDALIHAAVAIPMVLIAVGIGWHFDHIQLAAWIGAVATSIIFFVREVIQALEKYGKLVLPGSRDWSGVKTRETVFPMVAALLTAAVVSLIV